MIDPPSWLSPRQSQHDFLTWSDRFRAAMLGGAVGDALGAGVREQTTQGLRHWFGADGVTDLLPAFGRRGAGTELTQLTVFTLEALLRAKAAQTDPANQWLPTEFVRTNHLRWLHTQGVPWEYAMSGELRAQPEPNGWLLERPELFSTRNPAGRALRGLGAAAVRPRNAAEPPLGDEGVAECVVWAAPAMVWGDADGMVFTAAADVSYRLTSDTDTHGASGLHADVLAQLIRGVALWDAVGASESYLARLYQSQVTPVALHRTIRAAMFAVQQGRTPDPDTLDIEFDTGGRLGELGIALASVASTDTVADAILMAVNQSADSSVTGALAGQLAGAIHGPGGIPGRWRDELELGEIIETLCSDAAEAFAPPPPPPPLPRWAQRYVTDTRSAFSGPLELEARPDAAANVDMLTSVDTQPLAVSSERVGTDEFPGRGGDGTPVVAEPEGGSPTQILPVIDAVDDGRDEPDPVGFEATSSGDVGNGVPTAGAELLDPGPADPGPADTGFVGGDPDRGVTVEPAMDDPALAHENAVPVRPGGQRLLGERREREPAQGRDDVEPVNHLGSGHDIAAPERIAAAEEEAPVRARIDLTVPEPDPATEIAPEPDRTPRVRRAPARLWPDDERDDDESGDPEEAGGGDPEAGAGVAEESGASVVTTQWPQPWLEPSTETQLSREFPAAREVPAVGEPEDSGVADVSGDVEVGDEPAAGTTDEPHASTGSGLSGVGASIAADVLDTVGADTVAPDSVTADSLELDSRDSDSRDSGSRDSGVPEASRAHDEDSAVASDVIGFGADTPATASDGAGEGAHAAATTAPTVGAAQRTGGGHAAPEDVDAVAPSLTERVLGCFLGGALGDALGSDLEFVPAEQITERFGPQGPGGLREAYGVQGAITDDTQMTLFTAEGLIRGGVARRMYGREDPVPEVQLAYQRWLHTQGVAWEAAVGPVRDEYPQPDGWLICVPGLFSTRAPGRTVFRSLDGFGRGARPGSIGEPVNDSKGCGGVMRAAPAALWSSDPAEVFELAARTAALTHGHPSGYLSAGAFAVIVQQAVLGRGLDDGVWLALQVLETWDGHEETSNALAVAVDLAAHGVPSPDRIAETLGGGWVGEQALAIAVCATLAAGDDVELALSTAVHHSGDSDSTGAVCGNIIGALVGIGGLPVAWLADLELRDVVEQVAMDCVVEFDRGPDGENTVAVAGQEDVRQAHEEDWRERYPVRADRAPEAPTSAEPPAGADDSGDVAEPVTRMIPVVDAEPDRSDPVADDARGDDDTGVGGLAGTSSAESAGSAEGQVVNDSPGSASESDEPGHGSMPPEVFDPESRQPKPAPRRINPTRPSPDEGALEPQAGPQVDEESPTEAEAETGRPEPVVSRGGGGPVDGRQVDGGAAQADRDTNVQVTASRENDNDRG